MKRAKKTLLLVLCAALLVSAAVAGTVAYLTSSKSVTNTFTAGNVTITMTESKVNEYGVPVAGEARVTENQYLLVPGHTYKKDPIVHITDGSETCYVFVQISNDISQYLTDNCIETQLADKGWTKLTGVTGVDNVWYKVSNKGDPNRNLEVFEDFTVLTTADSVAGWSGITSDTHKIEVVAYAIQKDMMGDAVDAWNKLMAQLNT